MYDPAKVRDLADRAANLKTLVATLRDDVDAMQPLAVSAEALAAIKAWPEHERDCREHMLHATLHLARGSLSLIEAAGSLDQAAIGVEI